MAKGAGGRIHPVIPAGIAVVVCGVVLALVAGSTGDDGPEVVLPSSTTTTELTIPESTTTTTIPPEPVPVDDLLAGAYTEDPPASYRITYAVVENELPREETWTVRRPYESMVVSTRDGEITTATATTLEALWTYLADRQGWLKIQPELHRAAFDLRPRTAMGPMVALGLAEPAGDDEYLGRPCQLFRTGQPTGASEPTPPSDEETTELCVDASGLILREVWRLNGNLVTDRTATALELEPALEDGFFTPSPEIDDAEEYAALLGQIAVVADAETEARLQTDVALPAGYRIDSTILRAGVPGQGAPSSSEIIRFVSDGLDLVEYAEAYTDGRVELGDGGAVPIEFGGLSPGPEGFDEVWFAPGIRQSAVRVRLSDSAYAELRGTDPALLVDMVRSMTRRS